MASAKARVSRFKVRCEDPARIGEYWWIDITDALVLIHAGAAEWEWSGRWLRVYRATASIRGASCSLQGSGPRYTSYERDGATVVEPALSTLERFALNPQALAALGEVQYAVIRQCQTPPQPTAPHRPGERFKAAAYHRRPAATAQHGGASA